MRDHLFVFSLVFAGFLTPAYAQQSTADLVVDKLADRVAVLAKEFREQQRVPAISIAIGNGDELVYARAFGTSDLENAVMATEETVFRTASIAKPITAVAILQLVEQGKIGLEDPIQRHCPEFPATDDPLTVRHLLCHQGGIRHYKYPGEASGKQHYASLADSLELFHKDPLLFPPGSKFSYTTYGYTLLGRAVETASGMTFTDYLQQSIFDPAQMRTAGIDNTFHIIPNRTRGYNRLTIRGYFEMSPAARKSLKVGQIVNCEFHDTSMKVPGGGLICSPTDLVRFGQAMLGDLLLKPETKEQAWTAQQTSTGESTIYGLGWRVTTRNETAVVGHSGGQAGTSTFLLIMPERELVIAAMCNLQGAPTGDLAMKVADSWNAMATP